MILFFYMVSISISWYNLKVGLSYPTLAYMHVGLDFHWQTVSCRVNVSIRILCFMTKTKIYLCEWQLHTPAYTGVSSNRSHRSVVIVVHRTVEWSVYSVTVHSPRTSAPGSLTTPPGDVCLGAVIWGRMSNLRVVGDFVCRDDWRIIMCWKRRWSFVHAKQLFTARSSVQWMLLSNRSKMDHAKQVDHGSRSG